MLFRSCPCHPPFSPPPCAKPRQSGAGAFGYDRFRASSFGKTLGRKLGTAYFRIARRIGRTVAKKRPLQKAPAENGPCEARRMIPLERAEAELTVVNSRFIATIGPVRTSEAARAFIYEMREMTVFGSAAEPSFQSASIIWSRVNTVPGSLAKSASSSNSRDDKPTGWSSWPCPSWRPDRSERARSP